MKFGLFVIVALLFFGCQNNTQQAAPLGDVEVLQQLATAYKRLEENLPVAPGGMTPKGKRKFVEKTFQEAGYDSGKTLESLALTPREAITTHHKDMMELLFLPHRGLSKNDFDLLYSEKERETINKVESLFMQ